jgi:predicted transposase/invertase (TIGR01784 family)
MPFIIEKERDPLYKDGLQKGKEEGVEEGLEKGIEKGQKEREIAIAKAMLKQDMSIEMIVKLTGLLEKDVKKLKA